MHLVANLKLKYSLSISALPLKHIKHSQNNKYYTIVEKTIYENFILLDVTAVMESNALNRFCTFSL